MFDKVTISDIAKLVGVSKATVSYYLNGNYKKMSLETKDKIKQAIEVTGYQPNKIAQSLVTRDTQTIGVVIADITNPFISSVMKGIHDTCKEFGYSVNFTNSDNDLQIELENLHRLQQQNVSGIILDSVDPNNPFVFKLDPTKLVMVDRQAENLIFDTVVSDNKQSTRDFLGQMQEAGYQDIYFVTYPITGISTRELRYQGFKEVVSANKEKLIDITDPSSVTRIKEIIEKAEEKPAFLMMNGPTLLAFMKIVNQSSYHYPADFGLGSYEDLDWMEVLNPTVSCIKQDSYRIGCIAAKHLIHKLKDTEGPHKPQLIEVVNQLVIRKSF
ncbi:LacI family DNA-binding transcriptional regulator [Streptococcus iniae]|uniref:LacI family DNA-binding transcriptional regulator n=1 Tax=Streptococcus iniae TaxID=1346 RepID=A0A3L8GAC3_STRIN|nr:LacI family DNA-binding transcriptional regulator [Streptococcus iniae]AGM99775.1 transcriptional regulator, LacI family [Streptococcus iniae SF1]AHY16676.1 LacI family transcriptional regulator [Streptococcus iniae]AHY18541.1 LacI family transcriptional regulator [Streptococcus iniae]AJG26805.1 LacI family transcriptional regulator [Streptococcus iniae]APD32701.1 LacI family transcriptional regulator [Streptococcus iniae]